MRVLPVSLSLAVAFPVLSSAGPCEFVTTCFDLDRITFPPCTPEKAVEFELVAPALQACEDIAYFFTKGGQWPNNDKAFYCNVNSPCGSLVPYLMHVNSYVDACDKFKPYYGVMQTFHGYCRDQPVNQLSGDNGLLASLKSSAGKATSRPTPAPSRPEAVETPEPIPNPEATTLSTVAMSSEPPSATTAKPIDNKADANSKTASAASSLSCVGAAAVSIMAAAIHAALHSR